MNRSYPKQIVEDFGRELIVSGDLDPIYIALYRIMDEDLWDHGQVCRWMIAYWCFYHAGVASHMCEYDGTAFWNEMMKAAINEKPSPIGGRWPRGGERRHFRGKNGIDSVSFLSRHYPTPELLVDYITKPVTPSGVNVALPLKLISTRSQEAPSFGPWIGFKIADMVERILRVPVDFTTAEVFMFKDPEKAALKLFDEREGHKYPEGVKLKREVILERVTGYLQEEFADLKAPPAGDRPINIQEVETVLCKWKSHMNGHYPVHNDIIEINAGLAPWPNASAELFQSRMPESKT